jgi:YVTN family beta-propeller protein
LYVTNNIDNTVSVINGKTNQVIGSPITVGMNPNGIAFDSANGNLYVDNSVRVQSTVSVISGSSNTVIATIPVGKNPEGVAFDSANGNIYVANTDDNTVSVISGSSSTIIGSSIPVGNGPFRIAFDSHNDNMYVINVFDNTVSVISGQNNTVIGSPIPVGRNPIGIAFDSANDNLYVVNYADNTISVISISTAPPQPPQTTITSAMDGNNAPVQNGGSTSSNSITFTFTAMQGSNPIAGFQCSLDNSPFSSCTSPAVYDNIAAGPHKFTVEAVDTKGNKIQTQLFLAGR